MGPDTSTSLSHYVSRNPRLSTLYGIVSENLKPYCEAYEQKNGSSIPGFVRREFEKYLECGIYDFGFMRSRCMGRDCGEEKITAFSCKSRGFCPSCGGKRMVETALHLTEEVLPDVRYRQFVLTLPFSLRFMCAFDKKLFKKVHKIVSSEYQSFYRDGRGLDDGATGGVTFVQRFGSGAQFNLHYHSLLADGIWLRNAAGVLHFIKKSLDESALASILARISARIIRHLRRRKILSKEGVILEGGVLDEEAEHVSAVICSMQGKKMFSPGIQSITKIGASFGFKEEIPVPKKNMTVSLHGFSLHAGTVVNAHDKDKLFKLIEYQSRPPLSDKRLRVLEDDSIELKLKSAYSDGTTHLRFSGVDFLARLHALIPPPMQNQRIYFGVFAGGHSWREEVVALIKSKTKIRRKNLDQASGLLTDTRFAQCMAKTFKIDIGTCLKCKSPLRIMSFVKNGQEIFRYLTHTDQLQRGPPAALDS